MECLWYYTVTSTASLTEIYILWIGFCRFFLACQEFEVYLLSKVQVAIDHSTWKVSG